MAMITANRKAATVATATKRTQSAIRPRNVTAAAASESRAAAFGVSLLSAATLLLAGAPGSQAADLALGEQIFNGNCAACHQGGRNSVIAEKTLDKAAIEQYLEGGFNLEAIIYQVENGKGAMPAWADRLSEEEIQAVASYVYKQASEAAWKY